MTDREQVHIPLATWVGLSQKDKDRIFFAWVAWECQKYTNFGIKKEGKNEN